MWIYCITNQTTGKKYVGKTKRPVSTRWAVHCYDAFKRRLDTHFARAIRKHGKEDFHAEILESCPEPTSCEREKWWIDTLDTYHNGYNSTKGGDGGAGTKWSDEARERQSQSRMGMKFSAEHKANLSKAHKGKASWNKGVVGSANPLTGRKRPKDVCVRISKGKAKKVQQLTLSGELLATFASLQEAARALGISRPNISKCCVGLRQKAGGFRWRHV